jgi:hypothetical protein
MSVKNSGMTSLESRKQLLLAESELNRTQLAADIVTLSAEVRALTGRAKSFTSVATSALALVGAFQHRPGAGSGKRSWWQILLRGAGLMSSLWLAFRSLSRKKEEVNSETLRIG